MLLAAGMSDKQIARKFGISDMTARRHRANILRKTQSPNVCALLYTAAVSGWLGFPPGGLTVPPDREISAYRICRMEPAQAEPQNLPADQMISFDPNQESE